MRRFAVSVSSLLLAACGPSVDRGGEGDGQCPGTVCQNECPAGTQTSISGVVTAPNGIDPIPRALVYVPLALEELPGQVTCEICGDTVSNAAVLTQTAADGSFTLGPLPTAMSQPPGATVQVVAQKGRFRRVVDVAINAPCEHNALPPDMFKLPGRREGRNTIPRIAVATGDWDLMECVLHRIGIETGQFDLFDGAALTDYGGGGPTYPGFDTLLYDPGRMKTYNIIFINCTDNKWEDLLAQESIRNNVRDYVASGGRLYVTDWSYDWIEQVPEFAPVIDYEPGMSTGTPELRDAATTGAGGEVVQADVLDPDMADWLRAVEWRAGEEIISDAQQVTVQDFLISWVQQLGVPQNPHSKVWIDAPIGGLTDRPLTTTYDYNACGRWLYSSYHTAGREVTDNPVVGSYPAYCGTRGLNPQERILEYLILHVADCVQID